jgi:hypothetical protein
MKTLIIILLILGAIQISWYDKNGEKRCLSIAGLCNLIVIILLLLGKWG